MVVKISKKGKKLHSFSIQAVLLPNVLIMRNNEKLQTDKWTWNWHIITLFVNNGNDM